MNESQKSDWIDDAFDRFKRDMRFAIIVQMLTIILVFALLLHPGHCP